MGIDKLLKIEKLYCMRGHPNIAWHAKRACTACKLEVPQSFEKKILRVRHWRNTGGGGRFVIFFLMFLTSNLFKQKWMANLFN